MKIAGNTVLTLVCCVAAAWMTGCAPINKPILQRGWIGGEYLNAENALFKLDLFEDNPGSVKVLPADVLKEQSGGVLVTRVEPATPLADAGILEGDLILKIDGNKTTSLGALQKEVDSLTPGKTATLSVYRKGAVSDRTVTAGKETYQQFGTLKLGFGFGFDVDLWPDPDFSIFSLISFQSAKKRADLRSPEVVYIKETLGEKEPVKKDTWNLWVICMGVGGYDSILSQEAVKGDK